MHWYNFAELVIPLWRDTDLAWGDYWSGWQDAVRTAPIGCGNNDRIGNESWPFFRDAGKENAARRFVMAPGMLL